jgi:heptosyltransferase-2
MTLPALRAIRKAMPGDRIHLLVKPSVSDVFVNNPDIDEIILYDERYDGITGKLRLLRSLRRMNFSKAIALQNAFEAALISFLSGIPKRIGYDRDGRGFLLTDPIPYNGEDRSTHHIKYFLQLLRKAGLEAQPSEPWIYLTLEERFIARQKLSGLGRPIVGLNPGAAFGSAKRWPAERFASVADKVISELNGSAVVFGSAAETDTADEILALSGHPRGERIVSLAGQTSLRELAALISECDVLVTNDSGPMHMGYAVKTPLVAIFGSTDPMLTGPWGKANVVVSKDLECSPCFRRQCRDKDLKCMESITADEVFDGVRKLLPRGKAVFFDRDGTLCEDADFLRKWEDFRVFREISALKTLSDRGFMLIGATNQSGVARGIVDEVFAMKVNTVFTEKYGFTDFYYCPHHPDEHCSCRKPEPGMLLRARAEHGVDLKDSYMVGDNEKDLLLAKAVGAKAVLVLTGKHRKSEHADFTASGLLEAVNWILQDNVY